MTFWPHSVERSSNTVQATMTREFDLVVFGASGFTGQYVVKEILQIKNDARYRDLTWAVAGRNEAKIKETLDAVSADTGEDLSKVPVIVADVKDPDSLAKMAERAEVVVNVVGPYRFFGEPVVNACVEKGTSHVDISGEPQFLESMQLKYHSKALENKAYVVGACGFDSIPCEMGIVHLRNNFDGDLNAVEQYMNFSSGPEGYVINSGTWKSAVYGFAHMGELPAIRRKLFPTKLPQPSHKLAIRSVLHKDPVQNKWSLSFPGSDRSVVMRSQRHFYETRGDRPVQIGSYVSFESLTAALGTIFFGVIFGILAKVPFTRNMLANNSKIFSLGYFSDAGPTKKQIDGAGFQEILIGSGWSEKLLEGTDRHTQAPDKKKTLEVAGPDPGYVGTSICLIQSALAILKEKDRLPAQGGVYPPAAAFEKTSIIDGLTKRGVTFTFK